MKLPKTIQICGRIFRLKQLPKSSGGSFNEAARTIEVGTLLPKEIPNIFLHEVLEGTFAIRNMRYVKERDDDTDNGDYLFSFDHEVFEQAINDVTVSLHGISFK